MKNKLEMATPVAFFDDDVVIVHETSYRLGYNQALDDFIQNVKKSKYQIEGVDITPAFIKILEFLVKEAKGIKMTNKEANRDCLYCDKKKCTVCRYTFNCGNESKTIMGHPVIQYWCSECDAILDKYEKYCHNCGCKIDWEGVIAE